MAVTLDFLEPEVVCLILEYVNDTSPDTIKAVALVNQYLNAATRVISHRHKTVFYPTAARHSRFVPGNFAKTLDNLAANGDVVRGLRYLTIKTSLQSWNHDVPADEQEEADGVLTEFLGKIRGLKCLTWSCEAPLPLVVLDALHKHHTTAKLQIFNFTRTSAHLDRLDDLELALSRSPALTHLRTQHNRYNFGHFAAPMQDYRAPTFCRIVASAPNLIYAGIVVHQCTPMTAFVITGEADDSDTFDRLLDNFRIEKTSTSVKSLTIDGRQISLHRSSLDTWNKIVDLTILETLKFSRGLPTLDYLQHATRLLPNLKHVSLNLSALSTSPDVERLVPAAKEYLCSCSPLISLSVWGWTTVVTLEDLLNRHGPTLQSLQLHVKQEVVHQLDRQTLSVSDIHAIRLRCPRLKELTLDMNRLRTRSSIPEEDRDYEYYYALADFGSRLKKIQIYFDHGLHPDDLDGFENSGSEEGMLNPPGETARADDDGSDEVGVHENERGAGESDEGISPSAMQIYYGLNQHLGLEEAMTQYVEIIWKQIFGNQKYGSRMLDVKFGEWETYYTLSERFFMVRPHERDDHPHECVVKQVRR